MRYIQLKGKSLLVLCALVISVAACNSNSSSNTTGDTTTSTAQDRPADTVQQQTQTAAPVETTPAETTPATAPEENAAATTSPVPAASTASNNETKKVVVKKKVKVVVAEVPVVKHPTYKMDKTGVYEYAEVGPQYPGGQVAIERYINNHIKYPQHALDNNVEGKVGISFVVNENGHVTGAHVVGKGLKNGLDQEAVRVVASMPNWQPGMIKGKPIKTRVTLPITFRIES
jgi:protein TonB